MSWRTTIPKKPPGSTAGVTKAPPPAKHAKGGASPAQTSPAQQAPPPETATVPPPVIPGGTETIAKTLTSDRPNAHLALQAKFKSYGLDSLLSKMVEFVKDGFNDDDSLSVLLQDTDEYRSRFAGNETRKKTGKAVLSPAEYLSQEEGYRVALKELPGGMYNKTDYDNWIAGDVSPAEIGRRAQRGIQAAQNVDPGYKAYLKSQVPGLDDSHIAAWALDQTRAESVIQRQLDAGKIYAAAYNHGLYSDAASATALMDRGVTEDQARQGYSSIASILPDQKVLAKRYGDTYTQQDAEDETFGGLASAARKRKNLNDQEGAQFAKGSGIQRTTLGRATGGSY